MAAERYGARGVGFELDADLVRRSNENARQAGVSHDFDMGDWRPEAVRQLLDETGRPRTIYLWRITGRQPRP